MGPNPKVAALKAALARADRTIDELRMNGYTIDQAKARQTLVRQYLPEEEERAGVPKPGLLSAENLGQNIRGLGHGLADTATGMVSGLAGLTGSDTLRDTAQNLRQEQETYYNAEGDEGKNYRFAGRMLGEGATAMAGGAGVAQGMMKLAPAGGKIARAGKWLYDAQGMPFAREATRQAATAAGQAAPGFIKTVAGNVLASAPIDVAIGAGRGNDDPNLGVGAGVGQELMYSALGTTALTALGKAASRMIHGKQPPAGGAPGPVAPEPVAPTPPPPPRPAATARPVPGPARVPGPPKFDPATGRPAWESGPLPYEAAVERGANDLYSALADTRRLEANLRRSGINVPEMPSTKPGPVMTETGPSPTSSSGGTTPRKPKAYAGPERRVFGNQVGPDDIDGDRRLTEWPPRPPLRTVKLESSPSLTNPPGEVAPVGKRRPSPYSGPERRDPKMQYEVDPEYERRKIKQFLTEGTVTPPEVVARAADEAALRAEKQASFDADMQAVGGEGAKLKVKKGRVRQALPSDQPKAGSEVPSPEKPTYKTVVGKNGRPRFVEVKPKKAKAPKVEPTEPPGDFPDEVLDDVQIKNNAEIDAKEAAPPAKRRRPAAAPETPPNGEPSVNATAKVPTPEVKTPKVVKTTPKPPEGLPGEKPFNPDTDMDLYNAVDEAGNKKYVLRRTDAGDMMIAPAKGGGPTEAPPFEKLEARRPRTPGKQASSLKDDGEPPLNPQEEALRQARQKVQDLRRSLASQEARRAASQRKSPTWSEQQPTSGTPEALPKQSPEASAGKSPTDEFDLTKTPSPLMGHPNKFGGSGVASTKFGQIDQASNDLSVEAEVLRERGKATTPPVEKYTSPDPVIERIHSDGIMHTAPKARLQAWWGRVKKNFKELHVTTPGLKGRDIIGTKGETRTEFNRLSIDQRRQISGNERAALNTTFSDLVNALEPIRDANEMNLMTRKFLVEHDLEDVFKGRKVVLGLDGEKLLAERARLDAMLKGQPHITKTIENIKKLSKAFAHDLVELGWAPPEIKNTEWYLHHEILDFMRGTMAGSPRGPGLSTHLPKSLMKKVGSLREYNRDIIGVMANYYSSMREALARYKTVRDMAFGADFRYRPMASVAHLLENWDGKAPPPGYVFYNVRNGFPQLRGGSIIERMGGVLGDLDLKEFAQKLGIDEIQLQNAMPHISVPGHELTKDIAVIPKEMADELMLINSKTMKMAALDESTKFLGTAFKWAALNLNPVRRISRDFFGDAERWVAQFGLEDAFDVKLWDETFKDVKNLYLHNTLSPRMEKWQQYMVLNSGRIFSEIGDVARLTELRRMENAGAFDGVSNGVELVKRLRDLFPKAASFREDLLRVYTANMNYNKVLRGEAPNTGIVDPKEFWEIVEQSENMSNILGAHGEDPIARASAMVARNSLIDYGDFTPSENVIRQTIVPFYAWAKGNTTFWGRDLPRAIMREGKGAEGVVTALGSKAMRGAATVAAMLTTIRLWNSVVMQDAESKLPTYVRNQNHIVLPDLEHYNKTGEFIPWYKEDEYGNKKVVTVSPATASDDFFRMVGLDGVAPEFISYLQGDIDAKDLGRYVSQNMLYASDARFPAPLPSVVRTGLGSLGPFPVGLTQAITGNQLFPDPLNVKQGRREDVMGQVVNALALGGTPLTEAAFGLSDESMAPNQNTIFNPLKSIGLRDTPINREDTHLTTLRREITEGVQDIRGFQKRMAYVKAGLASRAMDDPRREREFKHMERILAAKVDRVIRKRDIYHKLMRYQETAGR